MAGGILVGLLVGLAVWTAVDMWRWRRRRKREAELDAWIRRTLDIPSLKGGRR